MYYLSLNAYVALYGNRYKWWVLHGWAQDMIGWACA